MKRIVIMPDMRGSEEKLQNIAPGWEIIIKPEPDVMSSVLPEAEIVLGWSREVENLCVKKLSSLRWIHAWSAGVDFLPLRDFRDRGIMVTSSRGMNVPQLSETAIGLMISLVRGFRHTSINQVEHVWITGDRVVSEFGMSQLHGKTIGILGAGNVGAEIAKIAKAMDMKVLGLTRTGGERSYLDVSYGLDGLSELLAASDFVVNVMPATPATEYMIRTAQFAKMKPTAYYVNVGRGITTDTNDLIDALRRKVIAGAGLDVVDPEPLPPDNPLWDMKNVILCSHIGGMGPYNAERVTEIFCRNLVDYVAGRKPSLNLINLEEFY
jgi:phosphoglycerate dehydrogenase-like enzyme